MRKLVVLTFLTLDGVMQAPGGPEEDPTGGFSYGGWTVPYFDDYLGNVMTEQMGRPFDLLLGRKTYEIFASYWPYQDTDADPGAAAINNATKYVASHQPVLTDWKNSVLVKDVAQDVKKLKEQEGPEIQVHGSSNLIQTLLKHDLIDEFWLKIFPVVLGSGKRLFAKGTVPVGFKLLDSSISPGGVIVASYVRAGEVKTGTFGT
jgi:dihydrofolate reductase